MLLHDMKYAVCVPLTCKCSTLFVAVHAGCCVVLLLEEQLHRSFADTATADRKLSLHTALQIWLLKMISKSTTLSRCFRRHLAVWSVQTPLHISIHRWLRHSLSDRTIFSTYAVVLS